MEDSSNTSNQEVKYDLTIHVTKEVHINEQLITFGNEQRILFSKASKDADLYLLITNGQFQLKDKDNKLSVCCDQERLLHVLKTIKSNQKAMSKDHIISLDVLARINNRLIKHRSKFSKQNQYLTDINSKLEQSTSLIDFAKKLFLLKPLKKFQTIHFFIHQKGQGSSNHLEITRNHHRSYLHPTTDFNSFYQSIKKSKNRSYGQSKLKGFNFEILGTFMAHEFSLRNHNIIIVISRDDFLPQSEEEVGFFNFLVKNLSSYIEILLEKLLISDRNSLLESALHEAPFEIKIETSNSIPTNNEITDYHFLKNGNTLKAIPLFDDIINQADVFHHERVSLLGELLNTLRHELSNPIFGLQLTAEILLMETDDPDNLELTKEILKSTKRSQDIIENFTKLYKDSEEYESVDVIQLVNEVFTLTKSESRHMAKIVHSEDSKINLYTNSTWLAQILFNLIINSAQAMRDYPNLKAQFEVNIIKKPTELIFEIKDNGPGIPQEKIDEIFKAFYTTKQKGTGLGLSIAKSLAAKLRGKLDCISDDKGAFFKLILPYEDSSN